MLHLMYRARSWIRWGILHQKHMWRLAPMTSEPTRDSDRSVLAFRSYAGWLLSSP